MKQNIGLICFQNAVLAEHQSLPACAKQWMCFPISSWRDLS